MPVQPFGQLINLQQIQLNYSYSERPPPPAKKLSVINPFPLPHLHLFQCKKNTPC